MSTKIKKLQCSRGSIIEKAPPASTANALHASYTVSLIKGELAFNA
jgi:hypothetical protein